MVPLRQRYIKGKRIKKHLANYVKKKDTEYENKQVTAEALRTYIMN